MDTILIVDDCDIVRATIAETLPDNGYQAAQAANGREALCVLSRIAVAAVILDVLMPEMDGIETLRELRRRWPALPVIAISGGDRWGCRDSLAAALKLGADRTLAKPFTSDQILAFLDALLSRRTQT